MRKKAKKIKAECPPPLQLSPGTFRVEVRPAGGDRKRVLICACDEICAYSREEVRFRHQHETVSVTGEGLWCRTYAYRTAEVIGHVTGIAFCGQGAGKV